MIAAEAAAAADGYARGALSAPEPARGRQRSAAPWGGGSRGSSKEPAKVNREDHRHEGGSECTQIHTKTQADVTVVCYCTVGCEGAVAAAADRPLPPDTRAGRTGQGRCLHAARHGGAVAQSQPGAGRRKQDGRRPASDEGAAFRPVLDGRRRRDWRHQRQRSRKATNRFSMLPRERFDAGGVGGR